MSVGSRILLKTIRAATSSWARIPRPPLRPRKPFLTLNGLCSRVQHVVTIPHQRPGIVTARQRQNATRVSRPPAARSACSRASLLRSGWTGMVRRQFRVIKQWALADGGAFAARCGYEPAADKFRALDQHDDLRELPLGHLAELVDRCQVTWRGGQQGLDPIERQARALRGADDREPAHRVCVIYPLPAHPTWCRQKPDLLVVADGRRGLAGTPGQGADAQQRTTGRLRNGR